MLAKLRALALILAFIAAAVPSFMYITDANRDWLWLHIGVNIFAYVTVALTTIQTTLDVAGRAKHKLHVPARFGHTPILAKWWTAVRLSWRWHALAALARVGLAHALAQHIHIIGQTPNDFQGILAPFFTTTYSALQSEARSQCITTLIGLVVLVGFSIADVGLLTAITLLMKCYLIKPIQILGAILWRLSIIISLSVTMFAVHRYYREHICCFICNAEPIVIRCNNNKEQQENNERFRATIFPILSVSHRAGFTLLDNGTMMAGEIMLPIGTNINFGCIEGDYIFQGRLYVCSKFDNLPHVLHQVVLGLGGLSLYAALTAFCLWLAQRRYRRQSSSVS